MKKTGLALALFFYLLMTSGCGNILAPNVEKFPLNSLNPGPAPYNFNVNNATTNGYNCPGTYQIQPNYNRSDGQGMFDACTNPSSPMSVMLVGTPFNSATSICAFPAVSDTTQQTVTPVTDMNGNIVGGCQSFNSSGTTFNFSTSYNAVFVIQQDLAQDFANCLIGGNYAACPVNVTNVYSYGKFR